MQSTEIPGCMYRYQAKSHRSFCMPRLRTEVLAQWYRMAKDNEAVWAFLAVLGVTIYVEFYL